MSFDHLAPFYRTMENLAAGRVMQQCRLAFLDKIPVPERILLAGEGPGKFLAECVKRFPGSEIVVMDSSAGMLKVASGQVTSPKVKFVQMDILTGVPEGPFDLVVTNFLLDCFPPEELPRVVENLGLAAGPSAIWLVADFQIPEGRWTGLRAKLILGLLYGFFRRTCGLGAKFLTPPAPFLLQAGFTLHQRVTHDWDLMKSEWWQRG